MRWAIWRACERLGILPPGTKDKWDDCDVWAQASILGFDQVRAEDD